MILIREDFLHYLWKFQFFTHKELSTTIGEAVQIFNAGTHNFNTGPDFFNARVLIEDQLWAGNVEIHVKSSDWYVHQHERDSNYDNVILHVVWENDVEVFHKNNKAIPTIELSPLVSENILKRYFQLFSKKSKWIHCENHIGKTDNFVLINWLESLYVERLQKKSESIIKLLKKSNNDWEKILFQLLAKNFGLKVNGESFFNLASSFNFNIIRKEKKSVLKLEALLFGQGGFFDRVIEDSYFDQLKGEYLYLKTKFRLTPIFHGQIQFFRLRPNNFPTIRLAQLAMLYHLEENLFSKIISAKKISELYDLLQVETSAYWKSHYNFTSVSKLRTKKITKSFADLVIINTIIPVKFVYSKHIGKLEIENSMELAKQIKPESNSTIKAFTELNMVAKNSFESQALLQLKSNYCDNNKCLQCAIGNNFLKKEKG